VPKWVKLAVNVTDCGKYTQPENACQAVFAIFRHFTEKNFKIRKKKENRPRFEPGKTAKSPADSLHSLSSDKKGRLPKSVPLTRATGRAAPQIKNRPRAPKLLQRVLTRWSRPFSYLI